MHNPGVQTSITMAFEVTFRLTSYRYSQYARNLITFIWDKLFKVDLFLRSVYRCAVGDIVMLFVNNHTPCWSVNFHCTKQTPFSSQTRNISSQLTHAGPTRMNDKFPWENTSVEEFQNFPLGNALGQIKGDIFEKLCLSSECNMRQDEENRHVILGHTIPRNWRISLTHLFAFVLSAR